MSDDMQQMVTLFATIAGVILPAVWHLSTRIQRIQGSQETHARTVETKLDNIEVELRHVRDEIKTAREGRANLWEQLNRTRTRVTRVETVVEMKKGENA